MSDIPADDSLDPMAAPADPALLAEVEALRAKVAVDPQMSFRDAFAELEGIVADLESDRLDVDALAEHVARGMALAAHCRNKVTGAQMVFEVLERS